MKTDIDKGMEIRDRIFEGNPYAQLSIIRKCIWALNILRQEDSTQEDKAKAEEILQYSEYLNDGIEDILK